MGLYINPKIQTKEQWLSHNAEAMDSAQEAWNGHLLDPTFFPVCLIDNGPFKALGVAFSHNEFLAFNTPDGRKKSWYLVARFKIEDLCPDHHYYLK